MAVHYAATLGTIAFAIVLAQSAYAGDLVVDALPRGMAMLAAFTAVGWLIGAVADYVVCQSVEKQFRDRLEWFQKQLSDRDESSAGSS